MAFTTKPDEATRQQLKNAGYKFENGQWYKNQTEGKLAGLPEVQEIIATSL